MVKREYITTHVTTCKLWRTSLSKRANHYHYTELVLVLLVRSLAHDVVASVIDADLEVRFQTEPLHLLLLVLVIGSADVINEGGSVGEDEAAELAAQGALCRALGAADPATVWRWRYLQPADPRGSSHHPQVQ